MSADFLPEFRTVPMPGGGYRGCYRLFVGKPFRLIPGEAKETAGQALTAAREYVRAKLNPPIRSEIAVKDVLGVQQWHEERAARQAEQQEQALGAIIVKGRQIKVERKERA
jgi:hypothetical protein